MGSKTENKINLGKIGVLMGGPSSEREISLKSGKAVYTVLKEAGIPVEAIDIISEDREETLNLLKSRKLDCAFLALHGRFGEDGRIQEILEEMGLPYTGSGVKASRLAIDKAATHRVLAEAGISCARYGVASTKDEGLKLAKEIGLPSVIKPSTQGSSIGLSIIEKESELKNALALAFSFDGCVIIEEYIRGREVTVGILDDKALSVIEIIPKKTFFDYEAKYHSGLTEYIVPARLESAISLKIKDAALAAHKALGCFGYSRVDLILSADSTPLVLEVNTIPGMTATSLLPKAAMSEGIEFEALCLKLISLAYEKVKNKTAG